MQRLSLQRRPPPSISDKLRRGIWQVFYLFAFRTSPIPFHAWRRWLLRRFGATVGARVGIYPTAEIWAPWNLVISAGVTVGAGANLYSVDSIEIGAAAIVSQGAHLCTASHDHNSESFDLITAPILVEPGAWIAAEAFIGPGVTIGEGAVAAARAVVVRPVAARTIVAGNPAKVISNRSAAGRNSLVGRAP